MKKFFLPILMAAVAMSASFTSCTSSEDDDVTQTKPYEFVVSKLYNDVARYSIDDHGSFLELTESGLAICRLVGITRAAGDEKIMTGTWSKDKDGGIVINGNQLQGQFNKGDKDIKVKVNGVEITASKTDVPQDTTQAAQNYCSTWQVGRTLCDGSTITISDPTYAKYYGDYGYPISITFTSLNTFYCQMSLCSVTGSWKWNGKKMDVAAEPFMSSFEWITDDEVALKFAVKYEGKIHDFKVYLTQVK